MIDRESVVSTCELNEVISQDSPHLLLTGKKESVKHVYLQCTFGQKLDTFVPQRPQDPHPHQLEYRRSARSQSVHYSHLWFLGTDSLPVLPLHFRSDQPCVHRHSEVGIIVLVSDSLSPAPCSQNI